MHSFTSSDKDIFSEHVLEVQKRLSNVSCVHVNIINLPAMFLTKSVVVSAFF